MAAVAAVHGISTEALLTARRPSLCAVVTMPAELTYLGAYPATLQEQVLGLLREDRRALAPLLQRRYPQAHGVRTDKALYHYAVSVQARHLELKGAAPDHRMHDEHGGDELQGGDVANGTLALRGRSGLAHRPDHGRVVRAARLRALAIFSRHAATGAATTPRCGCSTAWAAA